MSLLVEAGDLASQVNQPRAVNTLGACPKYVGANFDDDSHGGSTTGEWKTKVVDRR
jgi:hypothetical protein